MDRQQTSMVDEANTRLGNVESKKPGPDVRRRIPIISSVQAGEGTSTKRSYPSGKPEEWITTTAKVGERAYALRVIGDSMEPKFPEGAIIIVDPDSKTRHGSFVVALLRESHEVTFKQLIMDGKRYLKPLNPRYPIMEIDSHTTICGVVKQMVMSFE